MYGFLDPRNKTVVHFVQLALVVVTLIVAGVRLATKSTSASRTRSDSMALGMVRLSENTHETTSFSPSSLGYSLELTAL